MALYFIESAILLKSFNEDEQNNNHDAHTKLLIKLIDEEFHQMKKENF